MSCNAAINPTTISAYRHASHAHSANAHTDMAAVLHFIKWPNEKSRLLSAPRCSNVDNGAAPEESSKAQQELPRSDREVCVQGGRGGTGRAGARSIFAARIKFG